MNKELTIQFVLSLISIWILVSIYGYLNELEHCPCFTQINDVEKYSSDISFLKFYQVLEILSLLVFTFIIFTYKSGKIGGKKVNKTMMQFSFILTLSILMFISGYMSYNVLKFYLNVRHDCECVNTWQKYFIYLEGTLNSVYFLRLLYFIIFFVLLAVFKYVS
jgi:hypothetical protein